MFGSAQAYRDTVRQMVRNGTLLDTGMIYFDAGCPSSIRPWRSASPMSACAPVTRC
jgi:hypothetical protein